MENTEHYICTGGGGGEADKPDVCKSKTCPDRNKPFKECNCADGEHSDATGKEGEDEN